MLVGLDKYAKIILSKKLNRRIKIHEKFYMQQSKF